MTTTPILTIDEFRDLGILQEINRQILHPLGLAIFVNVPDPDDPTDETEPKIGGIFDYRDDPEGVYYGTDLPDLILKAEAFTKLQRERHNGRLAALGYIVQPLHALYDIGSDDSAADLRKHLR